MKAIIKTISIVLMIVGLISLAHNVGLKAWIYDHPITALVVTMIGMLVYAVLEGEFE